MRRVLAAIVSSGVLLGFPGALGAQAPIVTHPPTDLAVLIEGAVKARLGAGFTVRAHVVEPTPPSGEFVTASPDPMGRLGKEIIFTLTPVAGTGRPARVRAQVDVSGPHVEARGEVLRGHEVDVASAATVDGPVVGVPVKRLPELSQIIGQKALRPIGAGQVIESGFVALRHAVEPGDKVTVVAAVGVVTVTATMVAADGGDPGDIIRVVNHATQRSIRVRVVNTALVEVIDVR